jgi:UDP-N-acetylmuramate--alanine ligase
VGIGGVGMSALAQAYIDAGWTVSGSDRALASSGPRPGVLAALAAQDVPLAPDDGSLVSADLDHVVVSTAIEDSNADLVRAKALGVRVAHRAAALAALLVPRRLLAVAGTCGKSTVTAILGHLLAECGFDPVVVNGAPIVGWDRGGRRVGSTRPGGGEWAVAEVDESDKSLTAFSPYAAIVTNASADHYSKEEMDEVFDAFTAGVSGPVVDGRREAIVPSALAREIPLPGEHNAVNAECALRLARAVGADEAALAAAIRTFPGVERRLQKVGVLHASVSVLRAGGSVPRDGVFAVAIYDDYAHNPEKLAAMWRTLAAAYPKGIAVVWRPHGYGPLRKMLVPLADMFREMKRPQDALFLLPVYDAGGTADRSVNSDALAALVPGAELVEDLQEAESVLRRRAPAFGAIATAGARDPGLPVLARRLAGLQ